MADINLPELMNDEDLEILMDDEKKDTELVLEKEKEEETIFIERPTNKPIKEKKKCSDRQKAHLDKIRVLAQEKKAMKAELKREALKIVKDETPTTYEKQKNIKEENKAKKDYKEKTIKINKEISRPPPPSEEEINFNTHLKLDPIDAKKQKEEMDKMSFMNFMDNMEKFTVMKNQYESNKKKQVVFPKPISKQKPKQSPSPPTQILIVKTESHPYDDYFN
tara:strand:+ start:156 stop:818 length:663 start_codon:yes stop_codon:yes gene_type:complete